MLEHRQDITILDRLYGVIVDPVTTLRGIARDRLYGWAVLILLLSHFAGYLLPASPPDAYEGLPEVFSQPNALNGLLIAVTGFVITTLLLHLVAKILSGDGTWLGLVASSGFASFPSFFRLPFLLLMSTALRPMAQLAVLGIGLWSLVLDIVAIRETYGFSTGKAIGALCLTLAIMIVVAGGLGVVYFLSNPELAA